MPSDEKLHVPLLHLRAGCEANLHRDKRWWTGYGRQTLYISSHDMPVLSKGSRFHDTSVPSHRSWTVLRKVGEGQSAEVYSVRCEETPSTQVRHQHVAECISYSGPSYSLSLRFSMLSRSNESPGSEHSKQSSRYFLVSASLTLASRSYKHTDGELNESSVICI